MIQIKIATGNGLQWFGLFWYSVFCSYEKCVLLFVGVLLSPLHVLINSPYLGGFLTCKQKLCSVLLKFKILQNKR